MTIGARHRSASRVTRHRAWPARSVALLAASVVHAESGVPRTRFGDRARRATSSRQSTAPSYRAPCNVKFGLQGMGVAPAGGRQSNDGAPPPDHRCADARNRTCPCRRTRNTDHFGGGQTEVSIELPPGQHTLQLVLGDHLHVPHDPPIASRSDHDHREVAACSTRGTATAASRASNARLISQYPSGIPLRRRSSVRPGGMGRAPPRGSSRTPERRPAQPFGEPIAAATSA